MPHRTDSSLPAHSFPPIAGPDTRLLILGSMPGRQSLASQQYYAHPRNAFWFIMGKLFGAGPDLSYQQRQEVLVRRDVALWDVLEHCHREGSLDSSIRTSTEVANDLPSFLGNHPKIRLVVFNGQKAESAFDKHVASQLDEQKAQLILKRAPSTSPAHASLSWEEKLTRWRQAVEAVMRDAGETQSQ